MLPKQKAFMVSLPPLPSCQRAAAAWRLQHISNRKWMEPFIGVSPSTLGHGLQWRTPSSLSKSVRDQFRFQMVPECSKLEACKAYSKRKQTTRNTPNFTIFYLSQWSVWSVISNILRQQTGPVTCGHGPHRLDLACHVQPRCAGWTQSALPRVCYSLGDWRASRCALSKFSIKELGHLTVQDLLSCFNGRRGTENHDILSAVSAVWSWWYFEWVALVDPEGNTPMKTCAQFGLSH